MFKLDLFIKSDFVNGWNDGFFGYPENDLNNKDYMNGYEVGIEEKMRGR